MRRAGFSAARHGRRRLQHTLSPTVQITTLPNKLRVATEATPGHFASVGLYIDGGSRFETPNTSGASHFLDRMAYKSTGSRSEEDMLSAMHSMGGQIMSTSSRETIMYQSTHFRRATPLAVSLIADTVLDPAFQETELEAQRQAALYEIREIFTKPEMFLPEVLHGIAYNYRGLGNPLLCPEERVHKVDANLLRECMQAWYRPERMVIAGAGMHHQELVELVDKHFSSLKSSPPAPSPRPPQPQTPSHLTSSTSPASPKALTRAASYLFPNSVPSSNEFIPSLISSPTSTYTGGHQFIPDPSSEFNHLYVAFEGVGIHDEDIYALATMHVILGGGGSFSAGGPGKGMYSRLYTHILNHFSQIDHCASFHHLYADSSLFGLFASFVPASGLRGGNTPGHILPHLVHQLSLLLYTDIDSVELERAKNQLKSSLTMAIESRSVEVEDLGRQVLVRGYQMPLQEMMDKIDDIQPRDIQRVARRLFSPSSGNRPTVLCMGHDATGSWEDVFVKYGVGTIYR